MGPREALDGLASGKIILTACQEAAVFLLVVTYGARYRMLFTHRTESCQSWRVTTACRAVDVEVNALMSSMECVFCSEQCMITRITAMGCVALCVKRVLVSVALLRVHKFTHCHKKYSLHHGQIHEVDMQILSIKAELSSFIFEWAHLVGLSRN
jgi:hypothetical protein